jgi:hypothetical protein
MEQTNEKQLPETFNSAFADVPPLPEQLYGVITRKILRRKIVARSVWTAAASILVMISAFAVYHISLPRAAYNPEIADELASISSYYNSGDFGDNDDSNYENVLYIPKLGEE